MKQQSAEAAERCGVKPLRDPKTGAVLHTGITVGDGSTVPTKVAPSTKIDLGGYISSHEALIMALTPIF